MGGRQQVLQVFKWGLLLTAWHSWLLLFGVCFLFFICICILQIANVIHNLQKERDMSSLYMSSIGPDSKAFLVRRYPYTDAAIDEVRVWPASDAAK